MNRQWTVVLAVIALLGAGVVAAVKYGPENVGIAIGQKAPDYRVVDLATGDSVSLRTLAKDHVTVVNIWATWCGPCKEEMPAMQQAWAELQGKGFRIVAVSIDQGDGKDVKEFARQLGVTFPLFLDASGGIQQVYQTTGVPESFLLDKDGTIVKRVIGAYDWSSPASRNLIARFLGEPQLSSR